MASLDELWAEFNSQQSYSETPDYGNENYGNNNDYSGGETYQSNSDTDYYGTQDNFQNSLNDLWAEFNSQTSQPEGNLQQAVQDTVQGNEQANVQPQGNVNLQDALTQVTGQQEEQKKQGILDKPEIKTTPEREALIEEYNNLGNPNYLHTKAEREAYMQKHDELLGRLREIDEELGNGAMDYNFRDRSQSVLGGAIKGYGADVLNSAATTLQGFNELGEKLGGDTGQYAGWATDEMTRAAIPQQNDPNAREQQRQEVADMQATSDKLAQESAEDIERAKAGQSKAAQFGTDIATNAIQMGMDALAAGLTGGSSLAPMFVRSAGGGAREARNEDASVAQQIAYGTVRGGIEVLTEKMFDGLAKIYGEGFADDAVEKLIGKLGKGNNAVQTGLRTLFSGVGEALEEGASGITEPLTKMIYQGTEALKEYTDPEYWAENMYSMLVGYAMGGAGGAVNLVNGENARANAEIRENINQQNEIKNNLIENNGMSEEDATKASEILAKMARGETITQNQKAFLDTVQEANGIDTSKPDMTAPQVEDESTVPVPDSRKFAKENPAETPVTPEAKITQPEVQESPETPSVELNSKTEVKGPTAEEMEAAERAANAEEAPPKGLDKTLQNAQQKTEAAQKKAAEQPAPEPEKPLRKVKPYTENEKILAEDRARLDRQNKSLRKQVENLSKQTKRTDVKTARESDVKKAAREIVRDYGSSVDVGETTAKMQKLADYLVQHTGENIDYNEVQRMAEEIAADIVDNIFTDTTDEYSKQRAADIKQALKNNTVNFEQLVAQFSMEDAKTQFPGMKFAKTKGMSVQDFYDMLANNGLVEADVVGAREQLEAIYDVLKSGETRMEATYANDTNYDQAINETANEILDTLLSDAVRESEPTFADKQAAKLDETKARMQRQIDAEKEARQADKKAARERLNQFRRQAAASKKEAVAKEKAEKYKSNKRIQEQYQNMIERKENKRKTSAQRKKIKGLFNELSKAVTRPSEGKYVPKELMNAAIDLLESIDTDTGSVSSAEKLNKLRSAFNDIKNDPKYSAVVTDEVHQAMLDSLYETIGGTPLNEMSSDQLTRVYDTMKALTHEIKDGVKVKIRNEEHQASEISKKMNSESKQAKGWGKGALGSLNAWYTGAFGRATTYFERLGGFAKDSAWSQMGERLNEGQRKATDEKVRAARKFNELLTNKQEKTLRNTVKLGKDASGNDIEVSRGMMLSLKMLLDSEDGARHIKYGGLTIPGITDYYKGKNGGGFGQNHSRALGISPALAEAQSAYNKLFEEYEKINAEEDKTTEDWENRLDKIVSKMDAKRAEIDALYEKGGDYIENLKSEIEKKLTDYDKKWIQTAREYFDEAQVLLNDTTMDVYGFKKANVANYFPLVTDPNFRKASFESISRDMSLENSGFMKSRVKSGNPILLLDISEVIANYSDKVANYTGIMPAIRDFQKVYGKTEAGFAGSLQETLDKKFGPSASKYIEDLMADLQGARRTSDSLPGKVLSKVRGNMAQAVLSLNPRVALSQSASIMNAASEVGYAPIVKAMSMGTNPMKDAKTMDLITKYSPLLYYRTLGNSNAAMTDIQANAKWQNQMLKKFDFVMGWINAVDQKTVGRLWYASEAYVQQQGTDYAKGTDEYYEEVAKVFNRIVEKTQPNYTTMQRAGILREPNELVKSMTMFMTQRLQNQNILYEAGERLAKYEADFKNGENGVTEADVKKAKKDMFNALSSQLMSTSTLVLFKAGVDALMHHMKAYRDDDDELNAKGISARIGAMFADSLIGNFLGGAEIYSLYNGLFKDARYDGISVNGVATISDTLKDIVAAKNAKPEKQLGKTWKVVEDISKVFGIPLENAEKFVEAVWKHTEDVIKGNLGTFDSDLSEGYIDKMTKVDFGYQPVTNMFSPLYNAITRSSDSKEVAKEIQRLYDSTKINGVFPNIRGVNKITVDGVEYDLTGKEGQKYHETAGKTAEKFASELMNSSVYKAMTDEQKVQALKTLYGYAKDLAKDEFISDQGIKASSVTTATSLLKGLDKPGESNDKTSLNEKNLTDYVAYTTLLKANISEGDYKDIDKLVGWYDGLNKNMKTVLYERNTDLKRLLDYKDIGYGSETYYKMKESIVQSQINLDQSSNTSAYVRLYAVADCDLPESAKRNIVKNLMQGDDKFIGTSGKAAFNALSDYGFSVAQTAQFFDIALHCKSWKNTGEDADVNGQLRNDNTAFAIMQLPGLSEAERASLYNAIRTQVSNKNNDWGTYSYQSEVKYVTKATNKANYNTTIKISDKRSYSTSDALWASYLDNAS